MATPTISRVVVKQGPQWLVELFLRRPWWVDPALALVGLVVLVAVCRRVRAQGWHVDAETQLAMGQIAGTVVAVITGVLAVSNWTTQSYLVDVGGGFVLGYTSILLALSAPARNIAREVVPNATRRRTAAWVLLGVGALIIPSLVAVRGAGTAFLSGRLAIAGVAAMMAVLNGVDVTALEADPS